MNLNEFKVRYRCFFFMTRIATSQFIFFVVIADFVVVESELVLKRFFRSRSNISRETLIWVDLNYVKIVLGQESN